MRNQSLIAPSARTIFGLRGRPWDPKGDTETESMIYTL